MMKSSRFFILPLGVYLTCAIGAGAAPGTQKEENTPKIITVPIQAMTKAGMIDGTLDLPRGAGPFSVVVVIASSGPTDRDGNTVQLGYRHGCLKQLGRELADELAAFLSKALGKR